MAELFWKLVSKWAVRRQSYDAMKRAASVNGERANELSGLLLAAENKLRRFHGKVVIGPSYHKQVSRLLSVSCQLVDNPRSIDLKNQVTDLAIKFQQPEVVETMDGSLNG